MTICDDKIEFPKESGPSSLTSGQDPGSHKVSQVVIIHKHLDLLVTWLQVVFSFFECHDDCHCLLIVDVVVHYSGIPFRTKEPTRMKLLVQYIVRDDCTSSEIACISLNHCLLRQLEMWQYRHFIESFVQFLESSLTLGRPIPWFVLRGQLCHWMS